MVLTLLCLALNSSPDAEVARIQEHLRGASALLTQRDVGSLTEEQLQHRRTNAQRLLEYTAAARFPKNHHVPGRVPVFRDEEGTLCAVGALLWASGEHALVGRIVATRNTATVQQLADEPGLAQWLDAQGLTLAEAARIQPAYQYEAFRVSTPSHSVPAGACSPVVRIEPGPFASDTATTEVLAWPSAEAPSPFVWSPTTELFSDARCTTRLVPRCPGCSLEVAVLSTFAFRETQPGQLTVQFRNPSGTFLQVHQVLLPDGGAPDAGNPADAGTQLPTQPVGCGCEGGGGSFGVLGGALALLRARRRSSCTPH